MVCSFIVVPSPLMMPVPHPSSVSSDLPTSESALGQFIKELASSVRGLNSSVLLMTQYLVDGVITDDLRMALEATSLDPHPGPHHAQDSEADAFVVVPETAPPSSPATNVSPVPLMTSTRPPSPTSAANASEVLPTAPQVHVPPERRWYAVPVGRNPGVFQGAHNVTPNIERISGGYAVRCDSAAHARTVFDEQLIQNKVKRVTFIVHEEPISFQEWHSNNM